MSSVPDFEALDDDNFVEINWQPVDGAEEYRIYRMETTGDHPTGLVAINEYSNFQDNGLIPIKPDIIPNKENTARHFAGEAGIYSFSTL